MSLRGPRLARSGGLVDACVGYLPPRGDTYVRLEKVWPGYLEGGVEGESGRLGETFVIKSSEERVKHRKKLVQLVTYAYVAFELGDSLEYLQFLVLSFLSSQPFPPPTPPLLHIFFILVSSFPRHWESPRLVDGTTDTTKTKRPFHSLSIEQPYTRCLPPGKKKENRRTAYIGTAVTTSASSATLTAKKSAITHH
jgi:hypothetical protein